MKRSAIVRTVSEGSVEPIISHAVLARTRLAYGVEFKKLLRLQGADGHELEEELSIVSTSDGMRMIVV